MSNNIYLLEQLVETASADAKEIDSNLVDGEDGGCFDVCFNGSCFGTVLSFLKPPKITYFIDH